MALDQQVVDQVLDRLNAFLPARGRRMFGGAGIFIDDKMFALITSANGLYFKVDDSNRADYEAAGMEQFQSMPYFRLPEEVWEDPEQLRAWAARSVAVAEAAAARKRK